MKKKKKQSKIKKMQCMFSECSPLKELPDISKWDTSNIIDMSYIFNKCSSLKNVKRNPVS